MRLRLSLLLPSAIAVFTVALSSSAEGQSGASAAMTYPTVVTPEWLAARTNDPTVVVLHVDHGDYGQGHVPGARRLDYMQAVTRRGTVSTELPPLDTLRALFEGVGVSDGSTVVVYAHEAPMAMRVLLSLTALGVERVAYLDGGLRRWRADGHPVATAAPPVVRGNLTARPAPSPVVDAEWVTARLARPGVALIDTRTDGEYLGTGNRSGMPSAGHLAGAHQLEWETLFSDRAVTLRPREELERLYRERVAAGDTVVTYCWVGYRASATWFVARLLGYDARLYDGSYQDWSQRGLPARPGRAP